VKRVHEDELELAEPANDPNLHEAQAWLKLALSDCA
jgi:hypothetical protein